MRKTALLALALLLAGCTPVIIDDTGNHLLLKVDGMNDGVMEDANRTAAARCASYGKTVSAPTVHETGTIFPKAWYIEYDCVKTDAN